MKKLLNKKGFTIVEIIVTLAVLGIVIGPLMTMFITSQKINNEGSKEYQSIQLAQKYMEEIKGMDVFNYSSEGYLRTPDAGNYIYTKTIPETASNYGVNIKITSVKEDGSLADTPIGFDSTVTIKPSSVEYLLKDGVVPYSYLISGAVDLDIKSTGIIINGGAEVTTPLVSRKIKVELNRNAIINITNNLDKKVDIYIYNLDVSSSYSCAINVVKGEVVKLNNNSITPVVKTADNILYNITIEVKKGADVINTIEGTTIFKYIPN